MFANDQKYLSGSLIADSAGAVCRALKVGALVPLASRERT
jgi:hypothetical protein